MIVFVCKKKDALIVLFGFKFNRLVNFLFSGDTFDKNAEYSNFINVLVKIKLNFHGNI